MRGYLVLPNQETTCLFEHSRVLRGLRPRRYLTTINVITLSSHANLHIPALADEEDRITCEESLKRISKGTSPKLPCALALHLAALAGLYGLFAIAYAYQMSMETLLASHADTEFFLPLREKLFCELYVVINIAVQHGGEY